MFHLVVKLKNKNKGKIKKKKQYLNEWMDGYRNKIMGIDLGKKKKN